MSCRTKRNLHLLDRKIKKSPAAPTCRGLVTATREALSAAIATCASGKPLKCIGEAVAEVVEILGNRKGEFYHTNANVWEKMAYVYLPYSIHVTGILTELMLHKNQANVDEFTIHGWYGYMNG